MLIKCAREDEEIVKVDEEVDPVNACCYSIHKPLEYGWSIAEPKWHANESVEATVADNCCFVVVFLCNFYVPIP